MHPLLTPPHPLLTPTSPSWMCVGEACTEEAGRRRHRSEDVLSCSGRPARRRLERFRKAHPLRCPAPPRILPARGEPTRRTLVVPVCWQVCVFVVVFVPPPLLLGLALGRLARRRLVVCSLVAARAGLTSLPVPQVTENLESGERQCEFNTTHQSTKAPAASSKAPFGGSASCLSALRMLTGHAPLANVNLATCPKKVSPPSRASSSSNVERA